MRETQQKVVRVARSWIGTSFVHQGRSKKDEKFNGACDCIGLIVGVVKELDLESNQRDKSGRLIKLYEFDQPNYSRLAIGNRMLTILEGHLDKSDLIEEGNIVVFRFNGAAQHVGILSNLPDGRTGLIHCYQGANKVVEHELTSSWRNRILQVYKFRE